MVKDCKAAINISNLDTAIYLLRHVVYITLRQPKECPEQTECLHMLGKIFLMRFSYMGDLKDCWSAFHLRVGLLVAPISDNPRIIEIVRDSVLVPTIIEHPEDSGVRSLGLGGRGQCHQHIVLCP
jgi:hypothetical protein